MPLSRGNGRLVCFSWSQLRWRYYTASFMITGPCAAHAADIDQLFCYTEREAYRGGKMCVWGDGLNRRMLQRGPKIHVASHVARQVRATFASDSRMWRAASGVNLAHMSCKCYANSRTMCVARVHLCTSCECCAHLPREEVREMLLSLVLYWLIVLFCRKHPAQAGASRPTGVLRHSVKLRT
jgi:hypothetical protein